MAERKLSAKQIQRRADILQAARELIVERGYQGVTMRELADRSDVAFKTLYLLYDNKENLLTTAVEKGHRDYYDELQSKDIGEGLDRLLAIVDALVGSMLIDDAYTKTMAPVLISGANSSKFREVREEAYGLAVQQIEDRGDLIPAVDAATVTRLILGMVIGSYVEWTNDELSTKDLGDYLKLQIVLLLNALTTGQTHADIQRHIEHLTPRVVRSS